MSKGGGQGSFAQMQEPGMGMDMGGFGGEPRQQIFNDQVMPVGNSQNFSSGIGGKGGQLAPLSQGPGTFVTGVIPGGSPTQNVTGDIFVDQIQPIDQPIASPQPAYQYPRVSSPYDSNPVEFFNNLSQDDIERLGNPRLSDILGSQQRFNVQTQGPESMPRPEEQMRMNEVSGPARPDPLNGVDLNRFSGGLGSKGGRSNPYQTDGIVPPTMRGEPLPGRRQFDPIDQRIARPDPAPQRTSRYTEADHSRAEAEARAILGLPPKSGGTVYAGGTPNFDERTGEYRTGGIKPPRATGDPGARTMEFIDANNNGIDDRDDFRPSAPASRGRSGSFRDAIRELRDEFRYQPMPRREPPVFFPTPMPMPRPPRMPPRMQYGQPSIPGMNTQFQMPSFGSTYGQMNPYAGQFSGYGVPSNIFSFAQPHYQPYVPQAYTPPPPAMQLPPGQGSDAFTAGFGGQGIGGFGRYNLGLARRQFGGR